MKTWGKLLLGLLGGFFYVSSAYAEGGSCPSGYYPIGGGGTMGCAPIPNSNSNSGGGVQQPRPYIPAIPKRWVAIVLGDKGGEQNGYIGKAVEGREEAKALAIEQCQGQDALNCRVVMDFEGACITAVRDIQGKFYFSKPMSCMDDKAIDRNALAKCNAQGGKDCKVFTFVGPQ